MNDKLDIELIEPIEKFIMETLNTFLYEWNDSNTHETIQGTIEFGLHELIDQGKITDLEIHTFAGVEDVDKGFCHTDIVFMTEEGEYKNRFTIPHE